MTVSLKTMGHPASPSPGEREIVIELTPKRLFILILLAIPLVLIAYVGFELFSAYYGPRSLSIEFSLDRETYRPGDEVTVRVSVGTGVLGRLIRIPAAGVAVAIEVRNPGGDVVYVDQGETNAAGSLEFRFKILREAGAGEYSIYLACTGGSRSGGFRVEP
jgi:uncharacterized protein YfaS (alpha-2-macroglobulin family)